MLEFALCALPMFALFFGMTDIALAVFLQSMFQSGVRDGVRFGIIFSTTYNGVGCSTMSTLCTAHASPGAF